MDVLYKNPLRRLRVDAQKFDYAYLKERKLYQMFGNFKLLVGDVMKAAPEAWKKSRHAGALGRETHPNNGIRITYRS